MGTPRRGGRRLPLLSVAATTIVIVLTLAGAIRPELVAAMQRQPSMLEGEPWRFVTALFIYSDIWWKVAAALALFLLVSTVAELNHARAAWCTAFAAGGLTGEVAGLFWQPVGSGISVAGCGLLGLLLGGLMTDRRRTATERVVWPATGAILAAALCLAEDIHGPPVFSGIAVGALAARAA